MRERLALWLDLRPAEVRTVSLSFCGAFFALGFLVLGRATREALYLSRFAVESLPYITASVAVLSVPTVALFSRLVTRRRPQAVYPAALVVIALGLALLWPFVAGSGPAVIGFYVWTALGATVVTSGFWLITAELFPVRGAKRVFGLIGAGGTAGAMVSGTLLAVVSNDMSLTLLIPVLVVVLGLLLLSQAALPRIGGAANPDASETSAMGEGLRLAWANPHLRTIALLIAVSTVASTLVDYRFKEVAQNTLSSGPALAGFFGAFYGWTGAVALALQLLLSARLIAGAGIAVALGVLPVTLLIGAGGLLIVPGLVTATLVRGGDNALRKSLHRAVLEVLFVPIPAGLRRRTKTFIDSVADNAAEGIGALLVFGVVTAAGLPSRWLSLPIGLLSLWMLALARRARRTYADTVRHELRRGTARGDPPDLMAAETALIRALVEDVQPARSPSTGPMRIDALSDPPETILSRGRPTEVIALLRSRASWSAEEIPLLTRLLARDRIYHDAVDVLQRHEPEALPHLASLLRDPAVAFAIRRRIPAVLGAYESVEADEALLDGIVSPRFEVRYRCAVALARRRRDGRPTAPHDADRIWEAVRREVSRERPVWELQRLLDEDLPDDGLVVRKLDTRGALSLEHTFRLLSMVLDDEAASSAYEGIVAEDERLRSLSQEYLDHVLPEDVRDRLWPFIGDLSARQLSRSARPLDAVVSDLMSTNATFVVSRRDRDRLRRLLGDSSDRRGSDAGQSGAGRPDAADRDEDAPDRDG